MQKAKDSLKIQDIYLHKLTAECLGDFEPKYDPKLNTYKIQTMHLVEKSQLMQVDDEKILKVSVSLGVRWFDSEAEEVKALIEADFIAEYKMTETLSKKEIDAFAKNNVSYHIWPYWRELLTNQTNRMHLPKVVLQTIQLAQNS
ncbi:protein-export chaperone SecB [Marinospirillum insulare]|uniref:Preprotein translocase subunit SecB n=1 Tax=Marinospirillum insulare TaxID=217169 RepID=A0ABQ5ZWX0_9GAMM|nr:protein-export chaperone SecB [Marinospirillum insulare]GLR64671.1 hypothetical protein GCM10007878_21090 [Marinospirillum insulare]